MANQFAHDKMCALWEEVAETTGMNMSLSKDLDVYNMGGESNGDRAASASDNSNDNGSDREYIPQEYRFDVLDGIVSSGSDFEDLIDRNIPVNRDKAKRVLARIDTKGLRDPSRRKKVVQGFSRDLANAIDLVAYQTMINQSTMAIKNTSNFGYQQAIDAEVLMLNQGLGGFNKKLFLSNTDYAQVAKDLGTNQYYGKEGVPLDALSRAKIPDLATFQTMRSDYLLNLPVSTASTVVINGDQSATVATYDANGFFLDNRFMTLAMTNATTANMPAGTKFTVAGVNYLHPETRQDSGSLMTFTVVTAGTGSAVISPAIVTSGPYRNASAIAADTAAVVVLNTVTSAPSLFYTPESTVLVPGRLPVPTDGAGVRSVDATTAQGLPMRMTYTYDFHTDVFQMKGLVYFDCQVIYPNQVGIILSNQT